MKRPLYRGLVVVAIVATALALAAGGVGRSQGVVAGALAPTGGQSASSGPADSLASAAGSTGIIVGHSYKNDVSPPLRTLPVIPPARSGHVGEHENPPLPIQGHIDAPDTAVQSTFTGGSSSVNPAAITQSTGFEGINSAGGCGNCAPPDTNGDVSTTQYVQTVNTSFEVFNKSGGSLYGPAAINSVWQGFGGVCETHNDGDPVVVYDSINSRWVLSQFTSSSPYDECIAVSQTSDATGSWYRYAFQLSTSDLPDYPKLGVWPDGYYMTVNWFTSGAFYAGPRPYVFDMKSMIAGNPATFQTTSGALGASINPMLPSDFDGTTLPPSGAANTFVEFGSSLTLFQFHVDWTNSANTTWTQGASLPAASFTQICPNTRNCIAQSGTSQKLDAIGDRLMYRLAYRNFGTYESLVVNHTVSLGGGKRTAGYAGVRWYEIRNPRTSPTIYQQATYSPNNTSRWMGSVAMDKNGAIALGYSVSSSSIDPGIRVTGRLSTDPINTMPQGETTLYTGTGFQSGVNRWGDYSDMTVDPSDDCTFWYTQEYNNSGGWSWGTRINSFKLPDCP